jgi:hypothetical protein
MNLRTGAEVIDDVLLGGRMLSSFRKCSTPLPAVSTRPAMLCESVPLRDAVEGGCTEVDKVLCLKKGVVVGTCLFKSAQQIHPNKTSRKVIACPYGTG